jgi:serine/threonine-protein kinase
MSPEQARGLDNIDLRSDVWSFSVMLYETITGQTPFSSENYHALLRMIVEEEPASLLELKAADAELSALVSRGMSKEPALRFESMGHMGAALAQWLIDQGVHEDACGVSLEAKWLNRTTDGQPWPSRVSRSSNPSSWPEPPSGVRAVRSDIANAATVHVGADSNAPTSLTAAVGLARLRTPQGYLSVLGAAIVLVLVALWLSVWGFRQADDSFSRGQVTASPAGDAAPLDARPEPQPTPERPPSVSIPAVPPEPPNAVSIEALPEEPNLPPKTQKARGPSQAKSPPATQRPATAKPEQKSPEKPQSDLLSPY